MRDEEKGQMKRAIDKFGANKEQIKIYSAYNEIVMLFLFHR